MEENKINEQETPPKTNRELALQGIEEICQKYNLKPMHIAEAMSNKLKESTDMLKNEAAMYEQNMKAMTNKVLYKELIAREITANKVIDGHAAEMQDYEKNVIDTILGWIHLNSNEEIEAMMSIMEKELRLPYDEIKRKIDSEITKKIMDEVDKRSEHINTIVHNYYKQLIGEKKLYKLQHSK